MLGLEGEVVLSERGYLDLARDVEAPPTGAAQLLMRSRVVPTVYERWWRPTLGRLAKGLHGPSMAQELRLAGELLALEEGATVLDVGCGPGNFTRRFARDVGERGTVIGIDVSATMLHRAARDTDAAQVVYVRADVADLAIRAGSVEAVCCFAALHLFAHPWTALDVMARALTPGGRLAVLTTARPNAVAGGAVVDLLGRAGGVRMFRTDELIGEVTDRDLDVVHHSTFGALQVLGARRPSAGEPRARPPV